MIKLPIDLIWNVLPSSLGVSCNSSGQTDSGTAITNSTGGFYCSDVSPCTFNRKAVDIEITFIVRLAELQTEVELFRGAIYAAVDAMMAGQNVTLHASMIKLKLGRICRCVVMRTGLH